MAAAPKAARFPWRRAALWFALGLVCRVLAFQIPHDEGDEIIYRALVHQLEDGSGYTLRGTALVDHGWPADQYGHALFFHPPGGIALFWLLDRMFGEWGYALAQLLSYALFYWSVMALARSLLADGGAPAARAGFQIIAALGAFMPLMTHVVARYWLDGPMLGLVTLAAALYVRAQGAGAAGGMRAAHARAPDAGGTGAVIAAGIALGCASWVKTAALIALPAIVLLGAALDPAGARRGVRRGAIFAGVALAIQAPWQIWQWIVLGSPFPAWAGRPSPTLVAENPYVRRLTVDRPPWIYLTLMPRVVWTLVPALLGLALAPLDARTRRVGLALAAWIAIVTGVMIALGAIGYSKLLRYAILVAPASVLLFGLVAGSVLAIATDADAPAGRRLAARAFAAIAAAGLVLEIAQGVFTPLVDKRDLIWPLLWRGNGLY